MPPGLIKFEEFELDCARYELRRRGHALKLEKIPMELLMLLAAAEGRLVNREEIEERLWGSGVFVDAEHGINTAIRKIRQVLDDDPEQPRFVQTVQRKGYRFIAEAEIGELHGRNDGAAKSEPTIPVQGGQPSPAETPQSVTATAASGKAPAKSASRRVVWVAAAAAVRLIWPMFKTAQSRLMRTATPQPAAIRSLAVLPMENISGDASEEYFADGMTDELITMLAKYRSLRVISRTSVMQYKKVHRPLPEIARELGVDGIVEGSVVRSNDRVRVTAQLVYAPTDTHLWAETYDRDLGDMLSMQQELARSIAEHVELASSSPELPASPVHAPVNAAARDAYFRGRYYWFSERYGKSREFFQEAIQLDPSYAAAYAGLADSYAASAVVGESRPLEVMPLAESAAKKAQELDDSVAEAHHTLAAIQLFYHWDWNSAEKEIKRAIELNPSLAEAHHIHSYILAAVNRMEEAIQEDKRAVELDPFARPWAYGYALIRARRFDEALKELNQRSEARPESEIAHGLLAQAYYYTGDQKKAFEELKKTLALNGDDATMIAVDRAYRQGGFHAVHEVFLHRARRQAAKGYVSPLRLAELAAVAGHKEEAIHSLELAFEQRDPQLVHLQHDPDLDPLHSDPRYWTIVKKMGMPPLQ